MALPAIAEESGPGTPGKAGRPALTITSDPPIVRSRLKRALDVVGAAALLMLSAPVLAVIAVAIRLDSPGPVLHRQARCGYRARPFTCLKFRTMLADSDEGPHRRYVQGLVTGQSDKRNGDGVYKLVEDERVTRVGAVLRRTSLDELPQLWNVLTGDMTLVGPRPPLPYEVELYDERQHRRLTVKPGLTGLWQVSGRNQLSYRDMCELDLEYIRTWNHALDARILMRTLPVVFFNSGRAQ
jgi:lipopolysaccharide/colanic/teichoic acid biosynthesis glycosyltransferase